MLIDSSHISREHLSVPLAISFIPILVAMMDDVPTDALKCVFIVCTLVAAEWVVVRGGGGGD